MTEITWTNCAEQMPPEDKTRVIIKVYDGYIIDHGEWFRRYKSTLIAESASWTLYTPEKWKELNK